MTKSDFENILTHFFGDQDINNINTEEIKSFIHTYPLNFLGIFFLLCKEKDIANKELLLSTYFSNTLWIEHVINTINDSKEFHVQHQKPFDTKDPYKQANKVEITQENILHKAEVMEQNKKDTIKETSSVTEPQPKDSIEKTESEKDDTITEKQEENSKKGIVAVEPLPTPIKNPKTQTTKEEIMQLEKKRPLTKKTNTIRKQKTIKPEKETTSPPLHTQDYFSSQGVKVAQQLPKKTIKKSVKNTNTPSKTMSFISWLDNYSNNKGEANLNNITKQEVVTISMAQVYEKQKKYDKAIDVYNKIIENNPILEVSLTKKIEQIRKKL